MNHKYRVSVKNNSTLYLKLKFYLTIHKTFSYIFHYLTGEYVKTDMEAIICSRFHPSEGIILNIKKNRPLKNQLPTNNFRLPAFNRFSSTFRPCFVRIRFCN